MPLVTPCTVRAHSTKRALANSSANPFWLRHPHRDTALTVSKVQMKSLVRFLLFMIASCISASAQDSSSLPRACEDQLDLIITAVSGDMRDSAIASSLTLDRNATCFAMLLRGKVSYSNFLKGIEILRTDKQGGSGGGGREWQSGVQGPDSQGLFDCRRTRCT